MFASSGLRFLKYKPLEHVSFRPHRTRNDNKHRRHRQPRTKIKIVYRIPTPRPSDRPPRVGIIGGPLMYGQPLKGPDTAPDLLRSSYLESRLKKKGASVYDYGNLQFETVRNDGEFVKGCKHSRTVGLANSQIAERVEMVLKTERKVLLLGGDHSVAIGSIAGHSNFSKRNVAVIWVDAHPDINTPLTSLSGHLHGMPVSFLSREMPHIHPKLPGFEWLNPCISVKNLAYIGLRSIDPEEQDFIEKLNICAFSAKDVRTLGVDFVMSAIMSQIDPWDRLPIHLSFDVDAMDPGIIPATGTPVKCGLNLKEGLDIAKYIFKTGRLSVMDVVELNPKLSSKAESNWSADVIVEIIVRAFCGRRGYHFISEPKEEESPSDLYTIRED
ncbi:arginase-1-like isoform X1 [Biomphalaria glabrata]|nr:arginase-1-like isoform X1 [Biomphalaria glabrata]